jgi:hypothetical protein
VRGVPFEVEVDGESRTGYTDDRGRFAAPGVLLPDTKMVRFRFLDGFGAGLDQDRDGLGSPAIDVPLVAPGRLGEVFLLAVPKAMVLVVVPQPVPEAVARAVTKLDLLGVHAEGEVLVALSPPKIGELRELGIEVLVLHPDANAYAGETGPLTDLQRMRHIDERVRRARARLATLPRR